MTYNMGHQGARRGPWTVSLLGALERFHASRLRNRRRIHLCLKFVAMCYSSPWKLRQACSQKSVVWGGDLCLRGRALHPSFSSSPWLEGEPNGLS